jgi:hypothetical protein
MFGGSARDRSTRGGLGLRASNFGVSGFGGGGNTTRRELVAATTGAVGAEGGATTVAWGGLIGVAAWTGCGGTTTGAGSGAGVASTSSNRRMFRSVEIETQDEDRQLRGASTWNR